MAGHPKNGPKGGYVFFIRDADGNPIEDDGFLWSDQYVDQDGLVWSDLATEALFTESWIPQE